jgi:hypothetical protein
MAAVKRKKAAKPKASPKKTGRPTDYRLEYDAVAQELAAGGLTDQEMADHFGCNKTTLYRWGAKNPSFRHSIKVGKEGPDDRMEASLYHRGNGFEWIEQQAIKLRKETWVNGHKHVNERIEVVDVRRVAPPDSTAAIFWMKNRRGWKDRQELTGVDGAPLVPVLNVMYTDGRSQSIPAS